MGFDFDVITIGGGIIGAAISDELAKRKLKVVILEKNLRIAQETSEGNSGVIHGGFDPTPGKLNAKLNLEGRKLYENDWFKNLDFPWKKVDSLILAFGKEEDPEIEKLYKRGITNGLNAKELSILTTKEIMALEPNVNPKVTSALLCTASYAVDTVLLTQSLVNRMLKNNGKLKVDHKVINIETLNPGFRITCLNNEKKVSFTAKYIINAAGHYADDIAKLINCKDFTLKTRRGQYCILEKTERSIINNHILFMIPTIHGKGVIVAPMLDGHILVGPTSHENIPKSDTRLITIEDINLISKIVLKIIPTLNMHKICKVISGSRAICVENNDFFIKFASNDSNFINVTGIKSPGLSAAPAIALLVANMIKNN